MKKVITCLVLTLALLLGCCAMAEELPAMGMLVLLPAESECASLFFMDENAYKNADDPAADIDFLECGLIRERVMFDNLSDMLLAFNAGKVDYISLPSATARYLLARDASLSTFPSGITYTYQIAMTEDKAGLCARIDAVLAGMKTDGRLDALVEKWIDGDAGTDAPDSPGLPQVEGRKTLRVAVTGDIPPIDFIDAAGVPAGFNMALLNR